MSENILLVDDEKGIIDMLKIALSKNGYSHLYTAFSGEEALTIVEKHSIDLIILDIMLPDMDGFEICKRIRSKLQIPILFLSAKTTDFDVISGLTLGGDDYIKKPFNPMELIARIKAITRRQKLEKIQKTQTSIYEIGEIKVDMKKAIVLIDGHSVEMPSKEYELLCFFLKHPNQIFSIAHLYEAVWGEKGIGYENTVVVHIRRLRKKIEVNPSSPEKLINIRGLGYKFVSQG
ncbi:DNA-binding response regulator [Siminovitchia terrae]|nr:response regulator transcription factor [Siminovitchia terrae]GIN93685.1 DNA-binding response regulator [Siminovitchia terrae]GIN95906.1 DNA-binding response regulator [Siminovitchia terrae]